MSVKHVIILAAGKSLQIDGKNKLLIRHPATGKTILDYAIEAFTGKDITLVVGYGAVQIMENYPYLNYIINENWAISNNALSLSLALTQIKEPVYVISGDIFISQALIAEMDESAGNLILTENRQNRNLNATHCVIEGKTLVEAYQGPVRSSEHPEAIGLFKISDEILLDHWNKRSLQHGNLFIAQTLPCMEKHPIFQYEPGTHYFHEINSTADYFRLIKETRET